MDNIVSNAWRFSVAPMMEWTDRHCRYFMRLLSRHARLYTEMITTQALIHGNYDELLRFDPGEAPLAIQLGGSDPKELAACARLSEEHGYNEVNMNVGCPSDRVRNGRFGACLMMEPTLVAECIAAMHEAVRIPVTIKTRIGVDERDHYDDLVAFVAEVAAAGCNTFIIHARKAWLGGLSPKENREIPPLCYDRVYQLKKDFPQLTIVINGGIKTLETAKDHLLHLDGVMLGREAYHNPYLLTQVDRVFFNDTHAIPDRQEIILRFLPYLAQQINLGTPLSSITRHILGLFQGLPGARAWRRHLSENAHRRQADWTLVREAAKFVSKQEEDQVAHPIVKPFI